MSTTTTRTSPIALLIGAVGIVYGDIGTSPLYSLKEIFSPHYGVDLSQASVLGILSLIFWSLTLVVTVKYVMFILRADNGGEGGIMALTALAQRAAAGHPRLRSVLIMLGLFGAALFYGDSMLTPAVSVLSAVEGVGLVVDGIDHWVVPVALLILVPLFLLQRHGTARIGYLFGPVMVVWFVVLGALGVHGIVQQPQVLLALNPYWALHFFIANPLLGVTVMGAVVLTITGAEALYADMGHFGRRPIVHAWLFLAFPGLILNYFGQGAVLLSDPEAVRNPFYLLAPSWALIPLIGLSTLATIIASQAVITGAFSVTRQAIQLGYVPRMQILHTSSAEQGQIYIPLINSCLLIGVVLLVLGFQSSSGLAGAYGVAVTGTMLCTTLLVSAVILLLWRWPKVLAVPLLAVFLLVDGIFFAANVPKIAGGGAVPMIVGILLFGLMTTWKRGRQLVLERLDEHALVLRDFIASIALQPPHRVAGTAVFLTSRVDVVPHALLHNLLHNQVLHERVMLLTVLYEDRPRVPLAERFELDAYDQGFYRVRLRFGFLEAPDIPQALAQLSEKGLDCPPMRTTYFLSRETVIPSERIGMAMWRERLFAVLQKNAGSSLGFFRLPVNRVIELGTQVEI
ncbi:MULTISPECIES: potassium transporter Kup [Pseudomonas]|uniref:Probable potassium transport system protein Kup n=1 Tax=Phytopseudomonas flavescens TaxID=29435 RepID=A0A7Y9XPL6_9GAMM|nr:MULTISPECIES: potassium transporter Kup [Pseudomonas]MCW2290262.1 KUP system potassium uptake protein [Pseudomonas sp. BIGb0408]NYH75165.1 KUP system potassium uptake protein [Pseudomonas flavescens]